jgi:hypothetical protein
MQRRKRDTELTKLFFASDSSVFFLAGSTLHLKRSA